MPDIYLFPQLHALDFEVPTHGTHPAAERTPAMLRIEITGREALELETLLLDLNGTIALDGELLDGVAEALAPLLGVLRVVVVTADTHGRADAIAKALGVAVEVIERGAEAEAKLALVEAAGPERCVVIGNGANDALALELAAVGIAVVGPEGAAGVALRAADVVVTDITAALGMLSAPSRLIATLRR